MRKVREHPELRKGEVFLTNASDDNGGIWISNEDGPPTFDGRSSWQCVGWKTKRRGKVAYAVDGKPVTGMFPVFVKRSELEKAGLNPDKLFSSRTKKIYLVEK